MWLSAIVYYSSAVDFWGGSFFFSPGAEQSQVSQDCMQSLPHSFFYEVIAAINSIVKPWGLGMLFIWNWFQWLKAGEFMDNSSFIWS